MIMDDRSGLLPIIAVKLAEMLGKFSQEVMNSFRGYMNCGRLDKRFFRSHAMSKSQFRKDREGARKE